MSYEELYDLSPRRFIWLFNTYSKIIKKAIPKKGLNAPRTRSPRR